MRRGIKGLANSVLVSGCLGLAGLGLAEGSAHATTPTGPGPAVYCTFDGECSYSWCPGERLPQPDVKWDMNVCHEWFTASGDSYGGTKVGFITRDGRPDDGSGGALSQH
jgi:hypothetical protein